MRASASGRLPRCVRPVSRGRRPPSPAVEKEAERAQFCDPCNERDSQIPASVDTVLSALGSDRALSVMATVFTPHTQGRGAAGHRPARQASTIRALARDGKCLGSLRSRRFSRFLKRQTHCTVSYRRLQHSPESPIKRESPFSPMDAHAPPGPNPPPRKTSKSDRQTAPRPPPPATFPRTFGIRSHCISKRTDRWRLQMADMTSLNDPATPLPGNEDTCSQDTSYKTSRARVRAAASFVPTER